MLKYYKIYSILVNYDNVTLFIVKIIYFVGLYPSIIQFLIVSDINSISYLFLTNSLDILSIDEIN